jgi:hypothetical protein
LNTEASVGSSGETPGGFKKGLTWRALFGLIAVATLFIPVNIYLYLSTGMLISTATVYLIAILLSEIARYTGNPLSRQELFIIYVSMGAVAAAIPPYYWLVYRSFFVNTPVTLAYSIEGVPLPYLVPDWISPPMGSRAHMYRTLFQPEWLKPIFVTTSFFLLSFMADLGLSILMSRITVEVENLRFPFATIDASLIETITLRESERLRIFMAGFYPGLIYGAILYGGSSLGTPILPLPWIDLTWFTEKYIPGAIIGIATEPSSFVFGLLLPISTSSAMLVGSVAVWIVLNYVFTVNGAFFPQWATEYHSGMTIASIYQRTFQRIWISPQFGFALGLAAALLLYFRKSIVKTMVEGLRVGVRTRSENFPSFGLALLLYLAGSLGSVVMFNLLVPEIPLYIPLLTSTLISFMIGTLAAHSVGELGFFPSMPWPWQAIVYLTPYQGYSAWAVSPYICLGSPGGISQAVKVSYLTETRPKDYFKALVVATALNVAFGFVIVDAFWRLAPIPSSAYPASMIYWPATATNDSLFVTRQINLDVRMLLGSSAFSFALYLVGNLLQRSGIPFSAVPFLIGCYTLPTSAIMIFLGSIVGQYGISRYVGREKWNLMRGVLSAGVFAGVGVFLGVSVSIMLISKASWVWPW